MSRRGQAGFTLLEIMVVLVVFGFLLVGIDRTVHFGLTAWRAQARLSAGKSDLEAVDRSLRLVIENLLPPADDSTQAPPPANQPLGPASAQPAGQPPPQPPLIGTSSAMAGITALRVPGMGPVAVPVEAGLAVSGARLVLRWRPYHHGIALHAPPPPRETELMNGVARMAISYWQAPGSWVSNWSQPDLPLLVRIHLDLTGEGAAHWPDIIIAPLLSRP